MTERRSRRVVLNLTNDEFAILESAAHDDERDPFQHARYLLVGILRRYANVTTNEAPAPGELTASTAAD